MCLGVAHPLVPAVETTGTVLSCTVQQTCLMQSPAESSSKQLSEEQPLRDDAAAAAAAAAHWVAHVCVFMSRWMQTAV